VYPRAKRVEPVRRSNEEKSMSNSFKALVTLGLVALLAACAAPMSDDAMQEPIVAEQPSSKL